MLISKVTQEEVQDPIHLETFFFFSKLNVKSKKKKMDIFDV